MMDTCDVYKRQSGLSLIELMVSLALSGFLITGVMTLYFNSNNTDRLGSALSRIQESGRFALDYLAKDIRMAGYQGCADSGDVPLDILARNPPTTDFSAGAILGFEVDSSSWATGTDFTGTPIATRAKVGSDIIAIQRSTSVNTRVTGNMTSVNANIQITTNPMGFEQDDIVVISDCETANMFRIVNNPNSGGPQVTLAHSSSGNIQNNLTKQFNENAQVMFFTSTVYFIADTGRKDKAEQPIYALYQASDNMLNSSSKSYNIQELVEGVENMQILYGERLGTGNIRYVAADTAGINMQNVESVRLGLLIASSDSVQSETDSQTYHLPGEDITPGGESGITHAGDKRLRRVFSNTIRIRNRGEEL